MIALLAAVPRETELLRCRLAPCEVRNCGRRDLYLGTLAGQAVALMHSGVGKANAASAATSLVEAKHPDLVISFGCGGAYPGSGLTVGDLALASEEIYGDEGVLAPEGFLNMAALGFPLVQRSGSRHFDRYPVPGALLERARPLVARAATEAGRALIVGALVTVSTCSGTDAAALELARRTGGICENMEGAAVAQVCALHGVPFLEVRGISNLTEDRDLSRWNLPEGMNIAQGAVLSLLGGWEKGDLPA
jgi:futalosine hydrolase